MEKKRIPIGVSDYKEMIDENFYYVDKTLLVKELLHSGGKVTLLCRPRRFGKTLNLSMLHYFFEKSEDDTSYLFKDKAIWQHKEYCKLQGQFPVIYISFKDVKEETWEESYAKIISLIASEYERHENFIESNKDSIKQKSYNTFRTIVSEQSNKVQISNSLRFLCMLLSSITRTKVIVLIDEYDTPIHAAYSDGYYDKMVRFMRGLLSPALKDNIYLKHAVLTGILRTSKEGMFSGLNNLDVCTLLDKSFADKCGFTSQEVDDLLTEYGLTGKTEQIKQWYNGYHVGNALLYNPWSLIKSVKDGGLLKAYWTHTSDNFLVYKLITRASEQVKKDLEKLLLDTPVTRVINEAFTFAEIERDSNILWSLLLFAGYITYETCTLMVGKYHCSLVIPNSEIKILYTDLLQSIFENVFGLDAAQQLLNVLQSNNGEELSHMLQQFVESSMSHFDFSPNEPEKSYHLFVLGMLVLFGSVYQVRSNRESGHGRYDIMMIPHDKTKAGIILEFKKAQSGEDDVLEKAVAEALAQVREKNYEQELRAQKIDIISVYGIAFHGKKVFVKMEQL